MLWGRWSTVLLSCFWDCHCSSAYSPGLTYTFLPSLHQCPHGGFLWSFSIHLIDSLPYCMYLENPGCVRTEVWGHTVSPSLAQQHPGISLNCDFLLGLPLSFLTVQPLGQQPVPSNRHSDHVMAVTDWGFPTAFWNWTSSCEDLFFPFIPQNTWPLPTESG